MIFKILRFLISYILFINCIVIAQIQWKPVNTGLNNLNIRSILIHPYNTDFMLTGTGEGVFKSMDGGENWYFSSEGLGDYHIGDIVLDNSTKSIIVLGTGDGGVYKSENSGLSWSPINSGLPTMNVCAVAINIQNNNILYAGPDSYGIYRSSNGGGSWSNVGGGRDVRSFVTDPNNSSIVYAATVSYVLKTTNSGNSWYVKSNGLPSPYIFGLEIDPNNSDIAFCGPHQNGLYKTTNGGNSWSKSNNYVLDGKTVVAIAVNTEDSNAIYAGTSDSGVYKSIDGGTNWVQINDGLTNLSIGLNALVIDPKNPETIYVGTSGGGIFKLQLEVTNIQIESPQIGDLIEGGSFSDIIWTSSGSKIDHFSLFYSIDGGVTYPNVIAENVGNTGTYSWQVPNMLSKNTRIKLQAFDTDNNLLAEDVSDGDFIIGKSYKTNFQFQKDNYRFSNSELHHEMFDPLSIVLQDSNFLTRFGAILLNLSRLTSLRGSCLGMSISSTVYYKNPQLIPANKEMTYQLTMQEAEQNILAYQNSFAVDCLIPSMKSVLGFPADYYSYSEFMKNLFNTDHPVEILLSQGGYEGGHAVVAHRLVDYDEEIRVSIYDVNFPKQENITLNLTKDIYDNYYFEGYGFGNYFFNRFEPFDPLGSPADPANFWPLLWRWLRETIGDIFDRGKNIFTLACPANALLEDEYGRKIGILDGQPINEIPEANIISADSLEIYEIPNELQYKVKIIGQETGSANINLLICGDYQNNEIKTISFTNVPVGYNSQAQFHFSQTESDDSIQVDLNNDGIFEQTVCAAIDTTISLAKPAAPSDLTASFLGNTEVQLSWIDNSDNEYAFILERKSDKDTNFVLIKTLEANVIFCIDQVDTSNTLFYYRVKAITPGSESDYSNEVMVNLATTVNNYSDKVPTEFKLFQNYPNPFNSQTTIQYQLPRPAYVLITIYNANGQEIIKLVDEDKGMGHFTVNWEGKDRKGKKVTSGIYFYKLEFVTEKVNSFGKIKKMLYLK